MQDRQRYFEGRDETMDAGALDSDVSFNKLGSNGTSATEMALQTLQRLEQGTRDSMAGWSHSLGHVSLRAMFPIFTLMIFVQFAPDTQAIEDATQSIIQKINARHLSKSEKAHAIPEGLLRQMTSCQTSANEFLRHFWGAVLPPRQNDYSASAKATPSQKAAKAQKMITYLQKTQARVDLILKEARDGKQDVERIRYVSLALLC